MDIEVLEIDAEMEVTIGPLAGVYFTEGSAVISSPGFGAFAHGLRFRKYLGSAKAGGIGFGLVATGQKTAADSLSMNSHDVVGDVLKLWGCQCDTADDCALREAIAVVNAALQFIHANGKELPYLTRATRVYYLPVGTTWIEVEPDVQHIDGYVRMDAFAFGFLSPLSGAAQQYPLDFDPWVDATRKFFVHDGAATFELDLPAGIRDAEDLRREIQALILNGATVHVAYRRLGYMLVIFDKTPTFAFPSGGVLTPTGFGMASTGTTPAVELTTIDFTGLTAASLGGKSLFIRDQNDFVHSFWVDLDGGSVDPDNGDFGHEVSLSTGQDDEDIAAAFRSSIAAYGDFSGTTVLGAVVSVVTANTGRRSDAVDVDTGAVVTVTQQGTANFEGLSTSLSSPASVTSVGAVASKSQFDRHVLLYGALAPACYYLERTHDAGNSEGSRVRLYIAPAPAAATVVSADVGLEPARVTAAGVAARKRIPIPHRYIESLLLPIARWWATPSSRYRQRERHEAILQQYQEARQMLGIVDPQTGTINGKEAENV